MTLKKFSRTLTFGSSYVNGEVNDSQPNDRRQRLSVTRLTAKMDESKKQQYSRSNMQPLDARSPIDYTNGLIGIYIPVKSDFNPVNIDQDSDDCDIYANGCERYRDEPHWPQATKKQVKRVRFVICTLALFSLAMGLMSRLILNISIVEMVKEPDEVPVGDLLHELLTTMPSDTVPLQQSSSESPLPEMTIDELLLAAEAKDPYSFQASSQLDQIDHQLEHQIHTNSNQTNAATLAETRPTDVSSGNDDGLKFPWTEQEVNIVLGSFYIGYAPSIMLSGSIAQKYGSKYPLLLGVFGSGVINVLTPLIARYSLNLLIVSRIIIGIIQGSLFPCLYELFNRWLTQTESSIFAPMIKVSMPMGSLIGTMMPGILAVFELEWPTLFYIGGLMCFAWSIAWVFLASSLPQDNRFVGIEELNRIMRKKKNHLNQPAKIAGKPSRPNSSNSGLEMNVNEVETKLPTKGALWFRIVTNPSVLALTVVKFTYNIGMDFIFLKLPGYLRHVHNAPKETISAVTSGGYCMQMLLISFVGWLAKVVIVKKTCGLSVTKWRKIFQGSSNFVMALTYVVLAYSQPSLELASVLCMSISFWWMMGAGGESMLPYDLSTEYPASIVGFAHSISIFSGIALSAICGSILGEDTKNHEKWSTLFLILAIMLAGGGLVFVIIVKAKPFLPGEKIPKSTKQAIKLQQKQQINSISTTENQFGLNKINSSR